MANHTGPLHGGTIEKILSKGAEAYGPPISLDNVKTYIIDFDRGNIVAVFDGLLWPQIDPVANDQPWLSSVIIDGVGKGRVIGVNLYSGPSAPDGVALIVTISKYLPT